MRGFRQVCYHSSMFFTISGLLLSPPALAADDEPFSERASRARDVAITGVNMSAAGGALIGTAALIALSSANQEGCVDWCGNLALTLVTGGVGTALLIPGTVIALGGATRLTDLDHQDGGGTSALPVAVGWGLTTLGAASFASAAYLAASPDATVSPNGFIYAGLGLFAGGAGAGALQVVVIDDQRTRVAVTVGLSPNGFMLHGTF